MNKWIRVKDQLPDMGQPVLVWGPDENPINAYMVNRPNAAAWIDYADERPLAGVTHWMPLPAPP